MQAAQVFAASLMFGYFLRRVDHRFQLERQLGAPLAPATAGAWERDKKDVWPEEPCGRPMRSVGGLGVGFPLRGVAQGRGFLARQCRRRRSALHFGFAPAPDVNSSPRFSLVLAFSAGTLGQGLDDQVKALEELFAGCAYPPTQPTQLPTVTRLSQRCCPPHCGAPHARVHARREKGEAAQQRGEPPGSSGGALI